MKHLNSLCLVTTAFFFLFPLVANAQTPTVLTRNATDVSSSSASNPDTFIYATLRGIVNANGTDCSVIFEYGNTTSYGNTISAGTVTGSTDVAVNSAVTLNYRVTTLEQHKEINYRLVVTNAKGTFYGRNYIATPFDATRKIKICTSCSDSPTWAVYDIRNCNNNVDVTVNYTGGNGANSGSVIIGGYQEEQIYVGKNSIGAFYYQNNIFRQILTNEQLCSETQTPEKNILIYTLGRFYGSYSQLYKIENRNTNPATVSVQIVADTYTQTIPANSAVYIATGGLWDMQIEYNGDTFAIANYSLFEYEESNWLDITAVSSTYTTATFELYNRDDAPHAYVLRNAAGTEHSYNVPAHQSCLVTLPNEVWNVLIAVYDINATEWNSSGLGSIRVGETFGDPAYAINGKLKIATAIPAAVIPLTPYLTSFTQNSLTSFTINGTITGNATQNETVNYHFIYGTNPDNLNLTTNTQQITIPAGQDANVNTTISGLKPETSYYVKLVEEANESAALRVFPLIEPDNALNFNGTNNKISIPDNDASITTAFTLEAWVMWQPNAATDIQFICGKGYEQIEIHTGSGANALRFIPTTGVYLDVPNILPTGIWTHIACTYDAAAATAKIYINGNETAYTNNGAPVGVALQHSDTPFHLGCRGDGVSYFLKGNLDEFRVWNRALSQSEIRQNMKTAVNASEQIGLIDYYNFNTGVTGGDNSGQNTLTDLTGNFEGTLWYFALTGSTSNWVESYAMVVPETTAATSITTAGFTANWTAPAVGTVEKYLLDVSTTNDFGSFVESYHNFDCGTALSKAITGLTPSTQYYFRVRAEKTSVAGQGAYSNVVSAHTTDYATSDNQIKTEDGGILIYPNPTAGKLYIDINTLQKIKTIKLYNLQGQPVMCIPNPASPKIDISHFNTGMYLIEIVTESKIFSDKIFKR